MPRKRALAAEDPRIGKMEDSKLARSLGIAPSTVRVARCELGIPKYTPYRRDCAHEILSQEDLGDVADHIIATRLGIAKSYVQRIRTEYGVASTVGKCTGANHAYIEKPNEVARLMRGWGR